MNKNKEHQADEAEMDPSLEETEEAIFDNDGDPHEIDFDKKYNEYEE